MQDDETKIKQGVCPYLCGVALERKPGKKDENRLNKAAFPSCKQFSLCYILPVSPPRVFGLPKAAFQSLKKKNAVDKIRE